MIEKIDYKIIEDEINLQDLKILKKKKKNETNKNYAMEKKK